MFTSTLTIGPQPTDVLDATESGSPRLRHRWVPAVRAVALHGLDLAIRPGEFVTITGPSGSGKSDLISCLAGLRDPRGGQVWICGERMSGRSVEARRRIRGHRIGMISARPHLVANLTVAQNVELARSRVPGVRVGSGPGPLVLAGIAERRNTPAGDLCPAEAVRAGLAIALANGPAVLLADEPAADLDWRGEQWLLSQLWGLAGRGVAIVVASRGGRMVQAADRVVEMAGRLPGAEQLAS